MLPRSLASLLGVALVTSFAVGCAAESSGESDAPLDVQPDDHAGGSGGPQSELEIVAGPDIEFLESKSASVGEWEQAEGFEGDELEALLGELDSSESAGNVQPRFIGSVGKAIKGINFSFRGNLAGSITAFISKPLAGLTSPIKTLFAQLTGAPTVGQLGTISSVILALQAQSALTPGAPLAKVPARQAAKLVEKFGGSPADYRVSVQPAGTRADGAAISNRIYVNVKGTRRAVLYRSVTTLDDKTTVLDIPSGVL